MYLPRWINHKCMYDIHAILVLNKGYLTFKAIIDYTLNNCKIIFDKISLSKQVARSS